MTPKKFNPAELATIAEFLHQSAELVMAEEEKSFSMLPDRLLQLVFCNPYVNILAKDRYRYDLFLTTKTNRERMLHNLYEMKDDCQTAIQTLKEFHQAAKAFSTRVIDDTLQTDKECNCE